MPTGRNLTAPGVRARRLSRLRDDAERGFHHRPPARPPPVRNGARLTRYAPVPETAVMRTDCSAMPRKQGVGDPTEAHLSRAWGILLAALVTAAAAPFGALLRLEPAPAG